MQLLDTFLNDNFPWSTTLKFCSIKHRDQGAQIQQGLFFVESLCPEDIRCFAGLEIAQ